MGFFDFVKEAGESLIEKAGIGAGKASAAPTSTRSAPKPDQAQVLTRTVELLEIPVENLKIAVRGDSISVSGTSPTQADREKLVLVLGNTRGIARVDDQLSVVKPEPESVFYTVKKGDSLSKIAKAQYGDAMKYPVIFEANRPMLEHPDKIYPGQVLRIPPGA
ncbi:MAG: peptidoglycan-binding protein LysM [Myxococcales bacterium]|nr:peptidoglycan-binding protein LysM [Myxococcales bacterium]